MRDPAVAVPSALANALTEAQVGAEKRPAGEEAGPRAQRGPRERVERPGVVEVRGEPDKRVGDEQDAQSGEHEDQGRRAADQAGGCRAV